MSILWAEPFDQYGGSEAAMLEGPWAELYSQGLGSTIELSSANPRTGVSHLRMVSASGALLARRVWGDTLETVGFAYALNAASMPGADPNVGAGNSYFVLASFRDSSNQPQCELILQPNGQLSLWKGLASNQVLIGEGLANVLFAAGAYSHLEFRATISDDGGLEARLNGVTVMNLEGVDTKNTLLTGTAQVAIGNTHNTAGGGPYDFDDMFSWNLAGTQNDDFVGDKKLYYLAPNADTALEDFTPSTGSDSYAVLDDFANDADYISTAASTAKTALACESLPGEVASVAAVIALLRASKDDAGTCDIKPGIRQGSTFASAGAQAATTAKQYYDEVFEVDPVSGVPFTPADVNTLDLVVERSA